MLHLIKNIYLDMEFLFLTHGVNVFNVEESIAPY